MSKWSKLSNPDRRLIRRAGITAADLRGVSAIGFNPAGGGINNSGISLLASDGDAEEFMREAPVSRSVIFI